MAEPLASVLERQPAPLGELLSDSLEAERRDAREQADVAARDREVGDVAEVAVEARRGTQRQVERRMLVVRERCGAFLVGRSERRRLDVVGRADGLMRLPRESADHPERREVDPDRPQAGLRAAPA